VVARAPEPAPPPPPEPAPTAPTTPPAGPPTPTTPEPSPPAAAPRPSEPGAGATASARATPPAAPAEPSESPLAGRVFSLLRPLDLPPIPPPSGRGGTRPDGRGAGDSGQEREGQIAIPLNTPDPRYAEYFAELKRRIEDKWSYPTEASSKGQSGQGEIRFVLRKNGALGTVEIVHSSGVRILDSYIENAIRLASPFPPIPASVGEDVLPISINFTYTLGGFRVFGFR
jgi:protein TonB